MRTCWFRVSKRVVRKKSTVQKVDPATNDRAFGKVTNSSSKPGGIIAIYQSDINIYFNVKTFKYEPTSIHSFIKIDPFSFSHKSNKRERKTVDEDDCADVQGAEYQAVPAKGGKWRKKNKKL